MAFNANLGSFFLEFNSPAAIMRDLGGFFLRKIIFDALNALFEKNLPKMGDVIFFSVFCL